MKLPQIINTIRQSVINDCLTLVREGRFLCVQENIDGEVVRTALHTFAAQRIFGRDAAWRARTEWGENWEDLDYAIFGDGTSRRQKWIRKWLLRMTRLDEQPLNAKHSELISERLWVEAANA